MPEEVSERCSSGEWARDGLNSSGAGVWVVAATGSFPTEVAVCWKEYSGPEEGAVGVVEESKKSPPLVLGSGWVEMEERFS